jgi:hypothetical protein
VVSVGNLFEHELPLARLAVATDCSENPFHNRTSDDRWKGCLRFSSGRMFAQQVRKAPSSPCHLRNGAYLADDFNSAQICLSHSTHQLSSHLPKMAEDPPAYHCLYDHIPFEKHPERCPCIYHQVDGDLLLKQANEAEWTDWCKHFENGGIVWWQLVYYLSHAFFIRMTVS